MAAPPGFSWMGSIGRRNQHGDFHDLMTNLRILDFGCQHTGGAAYFDGKIDEVALYDETFD
jgi:hypothetical protein